jgi:hypothetical protein
MKVIAGTVSIQLTVAPGKCAGVYFIGGDRISFFTSYRLAMMNVDRDYTLELSLNHSGCLLFHS